MIIPSPSPRRNAGRLTAINFCSLVLFPNMVRSYPKDDTSMCVLHPEVMSAEQNLVIWNITGMILNIVIFCVGICKKIDPVKLLFFSLLHLQIEYPAEGKGGPGL